MEKTLRILEYDKIIQKLADKTTCPLGKEMALTLVPSSDITEVVSNLDHTDQGVCMILKKGTAPITAANDIRPYLKKASIGGILGNKELLDISASLRVARNIKKYARDDKRVSDYNTVNSAVQSNGILDNLFNALVPLKDVEDSIDTAIISEEEISDNASPALATVRRQIKSAGNKVKELLNSIIRSPRYQKFLQESLVTMRSDRYVIPVKAENRGDVAGIVHDSSSSGATLFIEPMSVVEANNDLRQLMAKEKSEIEKILIELTEKVEQHTYEIQNNLEIIGRLDFIFAKAKLALEWNAICPKVNDKGIFDVKKARHPLLDKHSVVPTDIYLGRDFNVLIITGPNTGGKTVTLKTIGLFTLMAQSGLHIPASGQAVTGVFDNVLADIGDEQSIEQNLSTFSSHMKNIVDILGKLDSKSLVLFDELGAGTDPVEGSALAMSILEHVLATGAKGAATTHYSELKLFALSTAGAENASCEFDVETLRPTYKLLIGIPGKSNAFAISRRLGLSSDIIERAGQLISTENEQFEDIILNLEQNRITTEREKEKALEYRNEIERLRNEISAQKSKLDAGRQKILDSARREALQIIERAKNQTDEIISELKKSESENIRRQAEHSRRVLKQNMDKINSDIAEIIPGQKTGQSRQQSGRPPKNLKLGTSVHIINLDQKGTVLNTPDQNGNVQVQVGIMKIMVNISNLRIIDDTPSHVLTEISKKVDIAGKVSTELHIRGQLLEDALLNTEKFIDDAVIAGLKQVTIVHGKGTGTLRSGVHSLLKINKHVKSYRLGRYGEGETGITFVELN